MFKKEHKDEIEHPMRSLSLPSEDLSNNVDLREWMTPIEHQEDMNTCCANAFTGVCEYLINRYSHRRMDISRLFVYYNGQRISQNTRRVRDEGVSQRDIASGLRKYGICQENVWPYRTDLLNVRPSNEAYKAASRYTCVPLRIPFSIKAIEICLHNEIPVLIDIILISNTGTHIKANHGYLTIPDLNNTIIRKTDFHTVVLVGYDRHTKYFIARNSWGDDWGLKGYFYVPYNYLSHKRLVNPYDGLWTIIQIIPRPDKLPSSRQLVLPNHHHHQHQHHRHH